MRANYLTLPSRKTKVCTSNTGSRITRTLGIAARNAGYRVMGVRGLTTIDEHTNDSLPSPPPSEKVFLDYRHKFIFVTLPQIIRD